MSGERYAASPSPAASSSKLHSALRIRLRVRPHSPLPIEPFLLPVNTQTADDAGSSGESQDDLGFLAKKILGNLSHPSNDLPSHTDLAMYLDGFRLTGWGTKLGDLIRDGDVIDVHHISRLPLPQTSSRVASSQTSSKKRKRQKALNKPRETSHTAIRSSSDSSSSSSSSYQDERQRWKSKKTRIASDRMSRFKSAQSKNLSDLSAIEHATFGAQEDVQAEADRISLLIKSEIGARGTWAADERGKGGRAGQAVSLHPVDSTYLEDGHESHSNGEELPAPPWADLLPSVHAHPAAASSKYDNKDGPAIPVPCLPPASGGSSGAAAAMAAFEARKRQIQREHRDFIDKAPRPSLREGFAAANTASSPSTSASGHSMKPTVSPSIKGSQCGKSVGNDAPEISNSSSISRSTSPSSSSSSLSTCSSDPRPASSGFISRSSSISASCSDGNTTSACSSVDSVTRPPPVSQEAAVSALGVPSSVPGLTYEYGLAKVNSHPSSKTEWVAPGNGLARTKRTNVKRRKKLREIMRATQERAFKEAQERAKNREAAHLKTAGPSEQVDTNAIIETKEDAGLHDAGDDVTPLESTPKTFVPRQVRSTILPAASAQISGPTATPTTIFAYEREQSVIPDGKETAPTLGWVFDVTPASPLIPYRDTRALIPPSSLSSQASIRLDLAKREKAMAELKEKIRQAEEQRRNLPPGGGMFDLDFASKEGSAAHLTDGEQEDSVPIANTKALPTSSTVPFTFAQQAPATVQRALREQSDADSSLNVTSVLSRGDGPPAAKKARTSRKPLALPPVPSTLPASSIPTNIRLTSVDCEAWYNGQSSSEYLYVPEGQAEKARASADDWEDGQIDEAEAESVRAYLNMRRQIRENLRKEKESEERQTALLASALSNEEDGALHPDLPLKCSSLQGARPRKESSSSVALVASTSSTLKRALVQDSSAVQPKAVSTVVFAGMAAGPAKPAALRMISPPTATDVIVAKSGTDSLPTEFGTEKTRAKQQSGKSSTVQGATEVVIRQALDKSQAPTSTPGIELGYLGPPGTYSHQVSLTLDLPALLASQVSKGSVAREVPSHQTDLVACSTITKTLQRVLQGTDQRSTHHLALLPYANSTYGIVKETESILAEYNSEINLLAATELRVQHALLVSEGTYQSLQATGDITIPAAPGQKVYVKPSALAKIETVYSHEQAIGQCSQFLKAQLPLTSRPGGRISVASTALAASMVAARGRTEVRFEAAIASEICATRDVVPGLKLLKVAIQDKDDNTTKFILVEAAAQGAGNSGADVTKVKRLSLPSSALSIAPTAPIVRSASAAKGAGTGGVTLPVRSSTLPAAAAPPTVHPDFFPGTSSETAEDLTANSTDPLGETEGLDYGEPEREERLMVSTAAKNGVRPSWRLMKKPTETTVKATMPTSTSTSTLPTASDGGAYPALNGSHSTTTTTRSLLPCSSSSQLDPSSSTSTIQSTSSKGKPTTLLDSISTGLPIPAPAPTSVSTPITVMPQPHPMMDNDDDPIKLARERAMATLKRRKEEKMKRQ